MLYVLCTRFIRSYSRVGPDKNLRDNRTTLIDSGHELTECAEGVVAFDKEEIIVYAVKRI